MGKDITRILVEATIRKTLKEIHQSPERTIRNLVDLALNFSNGRFQKEILSLVQEMLQDENSSYYTLASDIISHVKTDNITEFGLNLGYNSCTAGAKTIRDIEQKKGYNIPWSLSLHISQKNEWQKKYSSVITQGKNLGIYTYLLFSSENPQSLLPLIEANPDCAFILFVSGKFITQAFLQKSAGMHHLMYAVEYDVSAASACRLLRTKKLLYSVFLCYSEGQKKSLLSGSVLQDLLVLKPAFAFFIPNQTCTQATEKAVYEYISAVRKEQTLPVLPMDIKYDSMFIDSIISDDACTASFDSSGFLQGPSVKPKSRTLNCFETALPAIFASAFPK